jgi:hypothetical protein
MTADQREAFSRFQGYLTRFRYKPNFQINLDFDNYWDEIRITLSMDVRDVYDHDKTTRVYQRYAIHEAASERTFFEYLYNAIRKFEEHEIKEWFWVDGKHFVDPHPAEPAKPVLRRRETA